MDMERLTQLLETQGQLLQKVTENQLNKDATGTMTAPLLHGTGGMFSNAALERDVLTATITPRGLGAYLPRYATNIQHPHFSTITGFTETEGTRPDEKCEDATQGYMKACELTAEFGLNRQDTREIEMNKTFLQANRGDHMDLRLRGGVLGQTGFASL